MIDSREYTVYKHTNIINGKVYIGITKQKPYQRWGSNGCNYKSTPHFYAAITKYGWDNFSHEILFSDLTKEEACKMEINLIKENKSQDRNFGYNITEGGDTPSMPQEIREHLSQALKGNKNGLGKVFTEERKRHISEALKGKKFSEDRKKKISLAKKGKTHKPISMEARKKIAEKHSKKPVYCLELNRHFPSIQECARQTGITATVICRICKSNKGTAKGLHFMYA